MKRLLLTYLFGLLILLLQAQDPDFSYDFMLNKSLINPAYTAKITYITFNLTTNRKALYPNAPKYTTLWFSMPIGSKMGIGTQVSVSTVAQYYKLMMGGTYYFDVLLSSYSQTHLAFGISGGFFQDYLNTGQIQTMEPDPLLSDQRALSRFYPQVAAGTMIYNDLFEFGIAGTRLLPYSGYMFLNHTYILPPVLIIHGGYFYRHPIGRYKFSTQGAAFISKQSIILRPNFTYYFRTAPIKLSGAISTKYLFDTRDFDVNLHFISGFKIAGKFYITYEITLYSLFRSIPAIAKIGNAISLRYDFYPYEKDIPEFY